MAPARAQVNRAQVKGVPPMLLEDSLVNLDYKLLEELREELTPLFAAGQSTVVYATTEPGEVLLLGSYNAVMDEGPTAEVFHAPNSLSVARAFCDPPMNLMKATRQGGGVRLGEGTVLPVLATDGQHFAHRGRARQRAARASPAG